jgi:glycine cleavage system H protein
VTYPAHLRYTKEHEWIELDGDHARVGITDFAQRQLGDVVYVELPKVGTRLRQGDTFGTIESVKAVSELYAPVSGEVEEVNGSLKETPERINSDPHGSWLIVLKLSDLAEMGTLLDAARYADLVK